MTVEYTEFSLEARLKISPVEIEDEATYKCEITYLEVRENCDVVQIVKLTTLGENEKFELQNAEIPGEKYKKVKITYRCE
ncbi:hypothetical protein WA026_014610 [Henosepilachna vigintioctopunctata]|uniref:Ig-like domain-containing protein n=1 Tax=Henosepilachna vigintioctopunctata TaxID=420089 RepID=A0AAW1V883_9CUCU